nr:methyltransferase domain-containing protein [Caldibacillus thermoamylovorans]
MKQKNLIKEYDKQVTMYEKNRENPNMAAWRRKIINSANGNILEVGIGVGANFSHYNKEKVHVTGVDFSAKMIKSAKRLHPGIKSIQN